MTTETDEESEFERGFETAISMVLGLITTQETLGKPPNEALVIAIKAMSNRHEKLPRSQL